MARDEQLKQRWEAVVTFLSNRFADGDSLDLDAIIYLVGVQELGQLHKKFKKDEKVNLMHIAICRLLEPFGYYEFEYFEIKNNEVRESINAAERIQMAFFKSEDREKQLLPQHFVFFKPRDIVSGDFYWSHIVEHNNETYFYLSVVDCTGHGVPGALMSMLGLSLIKEVFKNVEHVSMLLAKFRTFL